MNEAELLFTDILKTDRLSLYLDKDKPIDKACGLKASLAMRRRIKGEPIQYILGKTEFMGLEFMVSPDVLIPRPETELLVEKTIEIVRKSASPQVRKLKILDVGTGSGCIAVSLAKSLPDTEVHAIDISGAALKTAKHNAVLNKVDVNFFHSDLYNDFSPLTLKYDLIVSNPPYIPSEEIARLQPEIQYEPRIGLDGGADGLDFYRRLSSETPGVLEHGGYLLFEIGSGQGPAIKIILENSRKFEIIEVIRDYRGIDRVIVTEVKSQK